MSGLRGLVEKAQTPKEGTVSWQIRVNLANERLSALAPDLALWAADAADALAYISGESDVAPVVTSPAALLARFAEIQARAESDC